MLPRENQVSSQAVVQIVEKTSRRQHRCRGSERLFFIQSLTPGLPDVLLRDVVYVVDLETGVRPVVSQDEDLLPIQVVLSKTIIKAWCYSIGLIFDVIKKGKHFPTIPKKVINYFSGTSAEGA